MGQTLICIRFQMGGAHPTLVDFTRYIWYAISITIYVYCVFNTSSFLLAIGHWSYKEDDLPLDSFCG